MAVTTDYDAPRRSTLEDVDTETLDALSAAAKTAARSPNVDLEEDDTAESIDPPGADLSGEVLTMPVGEVLTMPVVPRRADEFTCTSCFLVQHRSRIAGRSAGRPVCLDCA
jgi:Domain of unknown function (DUF4193)